MKHIFMKRRSIYITTLLLLFVGLSGCNIFDSDGSDKEQKEEEPPAEEPSNPNTTWLKGNLHAHSYWTDGGDYPDMILNWYKEKGYNFAVVSGHNDIHEGERTIEIEQEDEFFLDRYLDTFGNDWVEFNESDSTVNLKNFEEYSNELNSDDFLVVRTQEIDYRDEFDPDGANRLIHINAFNVQELIEPSEAEATATIVQETLDKVDRQSDEHNVPMMAIVNHPNIRQAVSADEFKQLDGARFFEVYSGHPNATNAGHGSLHSTEEMWDEVLTEYSQTGKELLYGVATDDSHGYNHDNVTPEENLPGRGWVQVKTEELTTESIIEAMYDGQFYASTGVELTDVTFDDGTLTVTVEEENGGNYTIQFIGTKSGDTNNPGVILAEEDGTEASYTLQDDDLYVRAKVISEVVKPNASSTGEVEVAYVQPVSP